MPRHVVLVLALLVLVECEAFGSPDSGFRSPPGINHPHLPNIFLITVDTLRADHCSGYGYSRPTTPNIDRLLQGGACFIQARTVEPLTNPALCSLLTSMYPHEHGATRNGLPLRPNLLSLPKLLRSKGYHTAAFVGNWTLKDKLSGLAQHFDTYEGVFTRKRWLGLLKGEASAEDLTERALAWIEEYFAAPRAQPLLLWLHYVDPHAPYRFHEEQARQIGLQETTSVDAPDRYDTEIAFADHHIGRLLAGLARHSPQSETLVVFAADHGESLGEHGDWGHGRHLFEQALRIPMALLWAGRIRPRRIDAPALNIDLAPTILGLIDLRAPGSFEGYDWSGVLDGSEPPRGRLTRYEAHRGAVMSRSHPDSSRRSGLLEIGLIDGAAKEILRVREGKRSLYDLNTDPGETRSLASSGTRLSGSLAVWIGAVYKGLEAADGSPRLHVDPETIEELQSLGYAR